MEGDHQHSTRIRPRCNFYPRPPGGGRRVMYMSSASSLKFLSTPSGWRATTPRTPTTTSIRDFYPRPPGGGRHDFSILSFTTHAVISIHALRVEGDCVRASLLMFIVISIHALRVEGDCFPEFFGNSLWGFLSTPSGWRATHDIITIIQFICDFYPRPPGGGRPLPVISKVKVSPNFYPRPPGGGRRRSSTRTRPRYNFYPRPPGGGRRV